MGALKLGDGRKGDRGWERKLGVGKGKVESWEVGISELEDEVGFSDIPTLCETGLGEKT